MHQSIRDHLEEYLKGSSPEIPREFQAHLEACQDCAAELQLMERQSRMLRVLQAAPVAEPRTGFYARVKERIEAQQQYSIWSVFLDRKFGLRLAVASATLALLLGTYLVSTEPGSMLTNPPVALTNAPVTEAGLQPGSIEQQQRDAVLVDLASYHE